MRQTTCKRRTNDGDERDPKGDVEEDGGGHTTSVQHVLTTPRPLRLRQERPTNVWAGKDGEAYRGGCVQVCRREPPCWQNRAEWSPKAVGCAACLTLSSFDDAPRPTMWDASTQVYLCLICSFSYTSSKTHSRSRAMAQRGDETTRARVLQ